MKFSTKRQRMPLARRILYVVLILHISIFSGFGAFGKPASQERTITGTVTASDETGGLPGVNVIVKGTAQGTVTDLDGNYSLFVSQDDVILVFSSVGYVSEEVIVGNQTIVNMVMTPDITALEEIVVVGYGTQKKSHLTGSVAKVGGDDISQIPVSRLDDALNGQIAGVNIQQTNPAAGEAPTITIRGFGSITGSSSPLVVVDGIAMTDQDYLASLNMDDVESVEVLKDASSATIYGSRGANGVIMITTKKGKEGKTKFSYDGNVGFKSVPENDVLTTVDAWSEFVKANNNGELTDQMRLIELIGANTDWQEVMMPGGVIQNHTISAQGGSANTKFRASMNYMNDEGVLLVDDFEKINFRLNLDTKVNKVLDFGVMLNPSYTSQTQFPLAVHDAIRQSPWLPIYLDESNIQYVNRLRENGRWADAQIGDYAMERMFDNYDLVNGVPLASGGTSISTTSNQGAYAKIVEERRKRYQTKVFANSYLKANITKDLFFKTSFGVDMRYTEANQYRGVEATRNGAGDARSIYNTAYDTHWVTENFFGYDKDFKKHSINAVLGMGFERWHYKDAGIEGLGYTSDIIETISPNNVFAGGASTYEEEQTLLSYFGRVNYSYNDKYLVSLSARSDGSSKFGENTKYGFFPAASIGWRISEEGFLQDNRLLSDLKIRASYGETGSNNVGNYAHLGLVSPVAAVLNGASVTGYNQGNISSPDLGWEKLVELDFGVDAQFFEGRLGVTFDYYDRTSEDLLLDQPVSSLTGFTSAQLNIGEVQNKGFEIEIFSKNISKDDFTWSTSAIMSHNENKIVSFPGANGQIWYVDDKRPAEWITLEGQPIAAYYGYVVKSEIDPQFIKNPLYPINANAQDIYVRDLNGDGLIDGDDRTILGSPFPDFVWSLTNTFTYKNFDLNFMFQGSHGAEVRNIDPQYINNQFAGNMDYVSTFPDAYLVTEKIYTNDQIMDASYVALRYLNLGYTLPNDIIKKVGLNRARLYMSAQNLLYFMSSGYTGYNPEGVNESPDAVRYGYQRGAAPIYKTISFGVNLEF